jgi:hypothetical protein
MDPDWLLLVVLLTPQQWGAIEAPPKVSSSSHPAPTTAIAECLRESCLDFLCFLRGAAYCVTNRRAISGGAEGKHSFALAEDALKVIETAPAEQLPSVETLASCLNTTRQSNHTPNVRQITHPQKTRRLAGFLFKH